MILGLAMTLGACGGLRDDGPEQAVTLPLPTVPGAPSTAAATTLAPTTVPPTTVPPTTRISPDAEPLPDSVESLATELSRAEMAIRDGDIDDAEAAAWGRRAQRLYRVLALHPDWVEAVVAAADDAVRQDVADNARARHHLGALGSSGPASDVLPAWRINEPAPAEELLGYYRESASASGVGWEYLAAINLIETRMGRIEGLSSAGAIGPMQFMPATWAGCCVGDPRDDRDAIMGAGVYLTMVGAPEDMDRALFGYNRSTHYVEAVKAYAAVIARHPLAYRGFHAYEVYFRSSAGLILLRPGFDEPEPVDAHEWLTVNPDALVRDD